MSARAGSLRREPRNPEVSRLRCASRCPAKNLGRESIRLTGSPPEIFRPPQEISIGHTYFPVSFMTRSIVYCRPFRLCQVSGLWQNWRAAGPEQSEADARAIHGAADLDCMHITWALVAGFCGIALDVVIRLGAFVLAAPVRATCNS